MLSLWIVVRLVGADAQPVTVAFFFARTGFREAGTLSFLVVLLAGQYSVRHMMAPT